MLSVRRATEFQNPEIRAEYISIHALREEGDIWRRIYHTSVENFYPRPPRGGRPDFLDIRKECIEFYPHPP